MQIQRNRPFLKLTRRRAYMLPVEQINPTIRIAHRVIHSLAIHERIIFDHELVLMVKGRGTFTTPDGPVPFKPGTLMFVRPFWPHSFDSGGKQCEHLAVHFDFRPNLPPQSKEPQRRRPYEVRLTGGPQIPSALQCQPM